MKIRVKKLKYEVDFGSNGQTHIIYVLDSSNEHEIPIYLNKYQKKFDIPDGKIIYS